MHSWPSSSLLTAERHAVTHTKLNDKMPISEIKSIVNGLKMKLHLLQNFIESEDRGTDGIAWFDSTTMFWLGKLPKDDKKTLSL